MDPNAQAVTDLRSVVSQFENFLHGSTPTVPGTAKLVPVTSAPAVSPLLLYGGLALAVYLLMRK